MITLTCHEALKEIDDCTYTLAANQKYISTGAEFCLLALKITSAAKMYVFPSMLLSLGRAKNSQIYSVLVLLWRRNV